MHPTNSLIEKILLLLRLYAPMVVTQFSLFAGTFFAVFMTGQYGTDDLAGMSIGFNIWITLYTGILGILLGISPIMAHLLGADKKEDMRSIIHHGLYLSSGIGIAAIIVFGLLLKPFLSLLSLTPEAYYVALHYMIAIGFAVLPLLWISTLRYVVDTHGLTHYSMIITLSGFILNVFLNYTLIFGRFGFPALGGVGAGWSTAITVWCTVLAFLYVIHRKTPFQAYSILKGGTSPFCMDHIINQLRIGVPIGVAIFLEVSLFSMATFAMSIYGSDYIAAHQAAYSFTNLFYCFPLTMSMASTIAVGYEVGARRYNEAETYSKIVRVMAVLVATMIAAFSFTHLETIASIYTEDTHMVGLIQSFLSYAVIFTLIDAFGTPVQGILRAYKDVTIITVISVCCYWIIGISVAVTFAKFLQYGPYGIWIGMLVGIAAAGLCFNLRLWQQQRKYR